MSDFPGALKELILPKADVQKPWEKAALAGTPAAQRAPWGSRRDYPIKHVRPKHKMIVAMHMAGFDNTEIAREFGYRNPQRISMILRSEHPELDQVRQQVSDVVAERTGDLLLSFHAESRKSLHKLVEIRDDLTAPRSEQRLSALAILDRAGYTPVKKQINMDVNVPIGELKDVVGQIESANQVVLNRDQWVVKNLPPKTGTNG